MLWRPALALACLLGALAGCGGDDAQPIDAACTGPPAVIERALERAPAPVRVGSGTRLSDCVSRARSHAALQNAGVALTGAAEHLAERAVHGDARAALALGYLVGATRRGAARTAGMHAELRRRVERPAAFLREDGGPRVAAALARGMRAGEASG